MLMGFGVAPKGHGRSCQALLVTNLTVSRRFGSVVDFAARVAAKVAFRAQDRAAQAHALRWPRGRPRTSV